MTFPKAPLELYGFRTLPPSKEALAACAHEQCPFLGRKCVKSRKSDATQSIGTCIMGSGGEPQITCPIRLLESNQIFTETMHLMDETVGTPFAIPEVDLPGFGAVDFVVARTDGNEIKDFYGVELQALDTTGSTWESRQDYCHNDGKMTGPYKYGINWKMTAKLVMIQTAHKSPIFEGWGKRYVRVLQDTLLNYMRDNFNFSGFHEEREEDFLRFYAYRVVESKRRFKLELTEKISGDLEALSAAMSAKAAIGEELLADTKAAMVRRRARWREL